VLKDLFLAFFTSVEVVRKLLAFCQRPIWVIKRLKVLDINSRIAAKISVPHPAPHDRDRKRCLRDPIELKRMRINVLKVHVHLNGFA
jgi:hypothetical protein